MARKPKRKSITVEELSAKVAEMNARDAEVEAAKPDLRDPFKKPRTEPGYARPRKQGRATGRGDPIRALRKDD